MRGAPEFQGSSASVLEIAQQRDPSLSATRLSPGDGALVIILINMFLWWLLLKITGLV